MLIESYDLEVTSPPCDPGAEQFVAVARLPQDIGSVLPFLNATLQGAIYDHTAGVLTWKKAEHAVAIRPTSVHISNLDDRYEAVRTMEEIMAMINNTWERRAEIEPRFEHRRRPTPMQVYKLLPGTNCRECGLATCFQFALQLLAGQVSLQQCPALLEGHYSFRYGELGALLADAVQPQ
jgi:ArsR family metal-binding transcriptional regulator